MTTPTNPTATPESATSDLTAEQQIAELLSEELPLSDAADEITSDNDGNEGTQTQEVESDADENPADEENQEDADEDPETWARALGLDDAQIVLDDDGNFKGVMTKVEGKTQEVDLKELLKGYQIDNYNTKKSEQLTQDRQRFEQMANQQAQELNQRIQIASGYVTNLEEQLVGEFQGINWEQLRATDPAEYAARRQDYAVRYNQVQQMAQSIADNQQQLVQQNQQKMNQDNYSRLQNEAQLALKEKPEWNDPQVRTKAMTEMGAFIERYGYSAQEIEGISDHRVIKMIDELMAYHSIKKEGAPKLDKKLPRYVKPISNRKQGGNTKKKQLEKLYNKAANSSNRKLKDGAIEQLLLNS